MKWAKCITPDCNSAYAMSKKALQNNVLCGRLKSERWPLTRFFRMA